MSEENKKIEMYYITEFKQIDRKIYQLFGWNPGRAIRIKSLVYYILTVVVIFLLRHIPFISLFFSKIPFLISYLLIPVVTSYLLTDIESEKRTVFSYVRSIVHYQLRKRQKLNFYRGKMVLKPQTYSFKGHANIRDPEFAAKENFKGRKYKIQGFPTYREDVSK